MKIKPDDIPIPCDDPFRHDLLDRKQPILALTNLLQNLETPYTMSIDASWGNGKTTFLNMWKQHLRNEGFPVVSFNAWETDFTGSPLVALTSELIEALETYGEEFDLELDAPVHKIQTLLNRLVPTGVVGLVYLLHYLTNIQSDASLLSATATSATAGLGAATSAIALTDESQTEPQEPNTYMDAKSTIDDFTSELKYVADALSTTHDNKPLIIAIDELDRCRPSYAVELLEIAKHFFAVDNIVFVLAIDKSQLSHAIKAIYGSNFDAIGYLRRFIDLDFRLPVPDRKTFMMQLMKQTGLLRFFENPGNFSWGNSGDARRLIDAFLGSPAVSIRQIQQALHHLGLALASLDSSETIPYAATAVLVILKTLDPVTYRRFTQSNMTDKAVLDELFGLPEFQNFRSTTDGTLLETLLIIGYGEFALKQGRNPMLETQSLFHRYCHIIDSLPNFPFFSSTAVDELSPPPTPHERMVLGHLTNYNGMLNATRSGRPVGFNLTAQRLELFSDDLVGENA